MDAGKKVGGGFWSRAANCTTSKHYVQVLYLMLTASSVAADMKENQSAAPCE